MTRLRRLCRFKYGDALPFEERVDGPVPVVSSGGLIARHDRSNLGPGIVIGRKGSYGSLRWMSDPSWVTDTAFGIDRSCTNSDLRYLYYLLHTLRLDEMSVDVGVPGLSRDDAYSREIGPPPHIEAQRRIADFLDEQVARLDAATGVAREMQALLEQRAVRRLHDAVTGSVHQDRVPSPLPWAPDLPVHWQVAKLSLVAWMGTGHTPSRSDPGLWVDTTIPWLTTNDVHRFRRDEIDVISDPALSSSRAGLANSAAVLHPEGTVALSRTASAGFSVIMGRDMATSQDFVTWTCGPRLLPHYLLAVLRASRQDLLGRLAMGSTHKTIYFPELEALRVPLPPLQEQERAVEAVQRVQQETRELRAEVGKLIDLLGERKRALITACLTGEFDVSTASSRAGEAEESRALQ